MALYHKHRPQTFDTVIHQEHIVTTLKNELTSGKIAHAYLFSGPHGVGKTTTARILAKSLNCTGRKKDDPNPCDTCDSCKDISQSRSIDVIEIDAASQTGVDNVRENIIENAQFKPTRGTYKIFIVDEVHMLSTAAFNALLKTLEEPPSHVVFILATTDAQKLPATVVSRCQRFTFGKVPDETMKKHLSHIAQEEGVTIDDDILHAVVRKARGGARDAVSILDQLIALGETHITKENASFVMPTTSNESQLSFLTHIVQKNSAAALESIRTLSEHGIYPYIFAEELVGLMRIFLIASVDSNLAKKEAYLPDSDFATLEALTKQISRGDIVRLLDRTISRMYEIKSSPLPYLPLELLVVEWSGSGDHSVPTTPVNTSRITPPISPSTPPPTTKTTTPPSIPAPETVIVTPAEVAPTSPSHTTASPETQQIPASVDASTVSKAWNAVIKDMEKSTPSLIFILKNATLRPVNNGVLPVDVAYSFHQDKLNQTANKKKIEEGLTHHLGFRLTLDVSVDPSKQPRDAAADLNDLAAAFGGSVV